jgi:hypothetical protein
MRATHASRMAASRLSVAIAIGAGLASATARAEPPPAASEGNEVRAEARFREGSRAFDEGRVDEACAAFDESLRLSLTLGTLLNLALCHERQGKTASAWLEFMHAAAWANDAAHRDRREFAHQHALRLEHSLSRVQVELPPGPPIRLEIDGEAVVDARLSLPVFLDPGPHLVAASAPARKRYQSTLTVPAASPPEALVVRIPPLEEEATPRAAVTPRRAPRTPSGGSRSTAGWIVGGAGVVAVGVGAYFGVRSLSEVSSLAAACPNACDPEPAKTSEIASLVAFGTGLAALAAGAWLVLWPPPVTVQSEARVRVVPQLTARSGGVGIIGAW